MKIILLNGPPGSGKDQTGEYMWRPQVSLCKFAGALKSATHALFGMPEKGIDAYEGAIKNEPQPEFFGMTPREAYIAVSERMTKPTLGDDFFGRVMIAKLHRDEADGCAGAVITDSGFAGEAQTVIKEFGAANVMLVRLHRHGHTFAGDSRSYLELPGIETVDIYNDKSLEYLRAVARVLRENFIG